MNHITGLEVTDNEGKFPSTLQPRADNTYDVGRPTKRWRTGEFVSVNVGTPSVEVGAALAAQATSLASLDTSVTALDTRISVLEAADSGGGGGGGGGGSETNHYVFTKAPAGDKYTDEHIVIHWDGYDEIFIRQSTDKSNVYATVISWTDGSFPSGQSMILSTTNNDYWQYSGAACVEFTIQCDSDTTFPVYRVFYRNTGSSGTSTSYLVVTRYN